MGFFCFFVSETKGSDSIKNKKNALTKHQENGVKTTLAAVTPTSHFVKLFFDYSMCISLCYFVPSPCKNGSAIIT